MHSTRSTNTFDPDELDRLYEPDAVLVLGEPMVGAARKAANARLQASRQPIEVRPRHVHVVGDIALLVVDWSIPDAGIAGTATDVARLGLDGYWRYVIDNPQPAS